MLGADGKGWHAGWRWQATQLFFTHFDDLPALETLCRRLLESFQAANFRPGHAMEVWDQHRSEIFAPDGPQRVAATARDRETFPQLVKRFALSTLPESNRFLVRLKECLLLTRLQEAELLDKGGRFLSN